MTKRIPVSEFKAKCATVVAEVKKYGRPISITKHGKVVFTLTPSQENYSQEVTSPFGVMAGTVKIKGDITKSLNENWDVD